MAEKNKKATQEGADLAQAAREYANNVLLNFDKEYEELTSNKENEGLLPKDLLIWEVIHRAYEKGANWMLEHPTGGELLHVCNKTAEKSKKELIDKACEWLKNKSGFTIGIDGATRQDFRDFMES